MALLIDGYNLLHVSDIFAGSGPGTELHRSRMALLNFLAAAVQERERRETAVVFDAAGAPPGLPRMFVHEGITVHFARRHSDADELIEELLEQHAAPRCLLVVSSDHRVQRAARRRGAEFIDSEPWYAKVRDELRERASEVKAPPAKPDAEVSRDEVAYWVEEFSESSAEDSTGNLFPPEYGDDLLEPS